MAKKENVIFWFRRDLRLEDNAGLYRALKSGAEVFPVFIFDVEILQKLSNKCDLRVQFIWQEVARLKTELEALGSTLHVLHGKVTDVLQAFVTAHSISQIFCNRDYEPSAIIRDTVVYDLFASKKIPLKAYKDQVIFDKREVVKTDGLPYLVFSPYKKVWLEKVNDFYLSSYPTEKYYDKFVKTIPTYLPTLVQIGFEHTDFVYPDRKFDAEIVKKYHDTRNFPSKKGTTRLSLHLRFGTISIRKLVRFAMQHNQTFLSELIWREFFMMILFHHPKSVNFAIKPQYDRIEWQQNPENFEAWCLGKTGYPIVDAGMRELNQTGFMHNRVRMIVASFLTKHLLLDWRLGEAYFADKLLDYDQSANIGGWQWASGSGCDAAPYFRIFNPTTQAEKFDADHRYIKKWVPELESKSYAKPIVDHKFARERALAAYKAALSS